MDINGNATNVFGTVLFHFLKPKLNNVDIIKVGKLDESKNSMCKF